MLEKYGWSQGAGLGVNLEGRTEHVKIRKKNNNAGAYNRTVTHPAPQISNAVSTRVHNRTRVRAHAHTGWASAAQPVQLS